jgi:hypothetical protein
VDGGMARGESRVKRLMGSWRVSAELDMVGGLTRVRSIHYLLLKVLSCMLLEW